MKRKQAVSILVESMAFSSLAAGLSFLHVTFGLIVIAGGLTYLAYKIERL